MRLRRPNSDESGAIAVLTALLMVVVLAIAALGVDIATQVNQRQQLHDTIDAAALTGAYKLPNGSVAASDALRSAENNDPALVGLLVPDVDRFCVVASIWSGSAWISDTSQIPATCNPVSARVGGTPPTYLGATYPSASCNFRPGPLPGICAIPCNGASDLCNTIRVSADKTVPFSFAPAIGINQGRTGSVTSVACKGPCGNTPPNPMDVAVVADRTGSMSSIDISAMITGIKGMLQVMTPSQQYVALGTIGRSKLGAPSTDCSGSTYKALSEPSGSETAGPWIPVPFSNNYLKPDKTPDDTSKLVDGVTCLKNSSSTGTPLASPMKYAARYLLGTDPPLVSLPARTGTVRKAIIFETDGRPRETAATAGTTSLTSGDVFSNTDRTMNVGTGSAMRYYYNGGHMACENMKEVAAAAKLLGITVITIAYNLGGVDCDGDDKYHDSDGNRYSGTRDCKTAGNACYYSVYATPTKVTDALASSASPNEDTGDESAAQNDCTDPLERDEENRDGDYFFCAVSGTVMAPIFETALGQLANGIRLIQLPPGA